MDIARDLNPAQREAVEITEGPILVLAGPGSGKTRVLVYRVAYLIRERRVRPYRIMAVTFTNKAAREMKERLYHLLDDHLPDITIGTFHAICARILRREIHHIGLDNRFVIYDDGDQLGLIAQALKDLSLDEKRYRPRAVQGAISRAKSELVDVAQYSQQAMTYWQEVVARVYQRYQELLAANNALDFDDLLMTAVRLFEEDVDTRHQYQERYLHILVDEFQDTNVAQYQLVKMLAAKHRNLFVVGDPDQSIYSWRNADPRNILSFENDYPEARVVLLEQNYRSTQTILDAAHAIILANQQRKDKRLWTENEQGLPITVVEAYNEKEEADYVVREIERLVARGLCRAGDCAVMYRTNAQSRVLEDAFVRHGVPYKLVGATRFYERREVKDVLAYLRLAHNPFDNVSLLRIINVPPRGIGRKTVALLEKQAAKLGVPLYTALQLMTASKETGEAEGADVPSLPPSPFGTRARQTLTAFITLLHKLMAVKNEMNVVDLLDLILQRTGYSEYIRDGSDEGEDRWDNVMELRGVAQDFAALEPEEGLVTFLEEVALVSDVDNYDERVDAPTLLTLHMAKGLEFPVVFIVGLEEGIFPHSRSMEDPAQMEEERRLCYVGITRTRRRLYLIYTFRRTLFGESVVNDPSRFLRDLPIGLIKGREPEGEEGGWELEPYQAADDHALPHAPGMMRIKGEGLPLSKGERCFAAGDRVRHPQFGEGIVINSVLKKDDEEVTVAFVGQGKPKRLLASYARLEKL
ncbi:MAG: ATP-dependent helicase [Anaerolineae bacterium]